ncbi:MAG: hypothetical protein JHC31_06840 [Sulfurihydrogenibium sp.]|jgi:hypothetical protein|nr:hypothetical protein [Sulfurihydrogenibium sp.]
MNYCVYDVGSSDNNKYFCDFDNKYYASYQDCYNHCGLTFPTGDNNSVLIHISNVDFTFLIGLWAILLAIGLFFAFHISHD